MRPPVDTELTTVADTYAVFHRNLETIRIDFAKSKLKELAL